MKAGVATVLQSKMNHVNVMEAFPLSCFQLCQMKTWRSPTQQMPNIAGKRPSRRKVSQSISRAGREKEEPVALHVLPAFNAPLLCSKWPSLRSLIKKARESHRSFIFVLPVGLLGRRTQSGPCLAWSGIAGDQHLAHPGGAQMPPCLRCRAEIHLSQSTRTLGGHIVMHR